MKRQTGMEAGKFWENFLSFMAAREHQTTHMTAAAKSVYYFGLYLYVVGATLAFIPNLLLGMLGIPQTNEVWIRILGVIVGLLGFYYHRSGATNNSSFIQLTVPARVVAFLSFVVFVVLKMASPVLIGFGVIDLVAAIWTFQALKK